MDRPRCISCNSQRTTYQFLYSRYKCLDCGKWWEGTRPSHKDVIDWFRSDQNEHNCPR